MEREVKLARVLVVEDDPDIQKVIRMSLKMRGVTEIVLVDNGTDCLERLNGFTPDVILLDLNMPTLDGLKAARLIREGSPRAEILIVTSYHSIEVARIAAEAGASGYVTKSLITSDLVPAIEEVVSRHAA